MVPISEDEPKFCSAAINRIIALLPNILATGGDDGVIKVPLFLPSFPTRDHYIHFPQLWDPRTPSCQTEIRAYTHHNDFISDFLWLADKKHLVATSGDGTLSVLDVRANKSTPAAKSENQEDELLSIVAVRGYVCGLSSQNGDQTKMHETVELE